MLKYEKEKEKKAFKAMTFREKMTHIRNYYMLQIIATIVILAIGGWALNRFVINPPKKASLSIINMSDRTVNLDPGEFQAMLNEQLPELCTDREEIQVMSMAMIEDDYQSAYYNSQKVMALVASQSVDIIIGSEELLTGYAKGDYFLHLDEFFSEEELSRMNVQECEVIIETDEMGRVVKAEGPFKLLISLGSPEILQSEFGTKQDLYLGIVANSLNPESVKIFIEYLLNLQ